MGQSLWVIFVTTKKICHDKKSQRSFFLPHMYDVVATTNTHTNKQTNNQTNKQQQTNDTNKHTNPHHEHPTHQKQWRSQSNPVLISWKYFQKKGCGVVLKWIKLGKFRRFDAHHPPMGSWRYWFAYWNNRLSEKYENGGCFPFINWKQRFCKHDAGFDQFMKFILLMETMRCRCGICSSAKNFLLWIGKDQRA